MEREILSREELPEPEFPSERRAVAVGEATAGLLSGCVRLSERIDMPEDIAVQSPLIQREIMYRILRTAQGARLRTIAATTDIGNRTARAIAWLRANYAKPLQQCTLMNGMDASAYEVGYGSVNQFSRAYRGFFGQPPIRDVKALRAANCRGRQCGLILSAVEPHPPSTTALPPPGDLPSLQLP